MTADVQYLFHDLINCVGYPLIEFGDDGSLQCMINNRFEHNCTFKIPEYNIYFFNLLLQRYWNGF